MASSSLAALSDVLRDIYMGPPKGIRFDWRRRWSCPEHTAPKYDRWGYSCGYDECPHEGHYVLLAPGCPTCKTSEYVPVEPRVLCATLISTMQWELSRPMLLLGERPAEHVIDLSEEVT